MWDIEQIDALTEAVVKRLLVDGGTARTMAPEVAAWLSERSPDMPALCVALPFTMAAGAIEDMLGAGAQARAAARDAWRVAALIGADALALEGITGRPGTVAGLAGYWRETDDLFRLAPEPSPEGATGMPGGPTRPTR